MKNYIKTVSTVIIALMTAACTKEISSIEPNNKNTIDVSIEGIINGYSEQEDTKASAQNVVRIMWAGGEKVYAYEGAKYLGELTASINDTDGTYARLSGSITAPTTGKTVTLVYSPQFASNPAVTEGRISVDLAAQDQTEVPFLIYGILPATSSSTISNVVVGFALATSVYKCNCAGLPKGTLTGASIGEVNTKCELTLSDSAAPTVDGSSPGRIERSAGFTTADTDQRAIFSVALTKTDATDNRTIEITKGGKKQTAAFAKTAFAPSKAYNAVFAFEVLTEGALPGKFTVDANGKTVHFSCGNLYFDNTGWGFESEQYYFRTYEGKGKCDSNGYREGTGTLPGHWGLFGWVGMSSTAFTGSPEIYGVSTSTTASDYGNIKTELLKSDWGRNIGDGNTWHSLSKDEWLYLFHDSKKFGFATVGGVPGIIILPDSFTDPKTNKGSKAFVSQTTGWTANEYAAGGNWDAMENAGVVFLPAAGYREGTDDTKVGSFGFYWSSSPFEYRADNAYCMDFTDSGVIPNEFWERYEGCCVRLVTKCQ